MAGIDKTLDFIPLSIAVLTISDSRTGETDRSGDLLAEKITAAGHKLAARMIVPDRFKEITMQVKNWIAGQDRHIDVIIATGGTGLAESDITYEAFSALYEKTITGFAFEFHNISVKNVGLSALQSRASAGIARGVCLFSLPGSPSACRDGWDHILLHILDSRYRPCNLIDIVLREGQ